MVVEARFRIRHRGCFTELVTGSAHMLHLSADNRSGVSVLRADGEAQIDRVLEGMRRALGPDAVVERDGLTAVVRATVCPDGVVSTIQAHGCTVIWPITYADGLESYTVITPARDRLDSLVARLREMGDVEVRRVTAVRPRSLEAVVPVSDITSPLTPRQLKVLRGALSAGYYESPRRVSTDELAKSFGIARSTFEEHLRKAERGVLEGLAGVLEQHPGLVAGASRRVGRPPGRRDASPRARRRARGA